MLRNLWLFVAIVALAALSSAFSLDDLHIDGIEAYLHHGEKRQASGTGNTPPPPPTTSNRPPPTSKAPPASSAEVTPTPPANSDPPKSSSPPQSVQQTSAANSQPTSAPAPTSNKATPTQRTTPVVIITPLVSTSLEAFTSVFVTVSDGQTTTITSTGTSAIPITTGQATMTDAATSPQNANSGSGLSQSNKNIIGGVVGGVGGALLLGGIALVFLRMKRRQTRVHEDDDDMTLGTGSALGDKAHSGHGASPFQSNLEQYHNPGGRPNAAANF